MYFLYDGTHAYIVGEKKTGLKKKCRTGLTFL